MHHYFAIAVLITAHLLTPLAHAIHWLAPSFGSLAVVSTTTYLADAKNVYGAIQDQVNTEAVFMNLLGDGSKFGKPVNDLGIRGYTFLARMGPNWNMGYRPEGFTGVANGTGNNAGNQQLANSTVTLTYAYVPIVITGQANELTKGDKRAFMQAKALEAKFDMTDIVSHVNVVMVGAQRGGQLAQVLTAASSTTITMSTANNLPGCKYLRVGMPIDSGPVGGGVTVAALNITAINYATNVLTVQTQAGGVPGTLPAVGDAFYLAGEAAPTTGTFPYTAEGLVSLVNNTTAIQGLNPATSGQAAWQAYMQNMAGATVSTQSMDQLRQFVKIRSGQNVDFWFTAPAQTNSLTGIATALLYFRTDAGGVGKKALDLGYTAYEFGGIPIIEDKDSLDDRFYAGASSLYKKFEALPLSMADDEAGDWTRISGSNGLADAVQGLLRWYHQLGTLQRNAMGVQTNYLVPPGFVGQPPSF